MIRKLVFLGLILALLALPVAACAQEAPAPAPAEVIELDLNLHIPPTHQAWSYTLEPLLQNITDRTGGKIKVIPHFSNTLVSFTEGYDAVTSGLADMGEGLPAYIQRGRFPLTEMASFLRLPPNEFKQGLATWEVYKKYPEVQNEFKDVKVLLLYGNTSSQLLTHDKAVRKMEDLEGLVLDASARFADVYGALAAVGTLKPGEELYTALERGVLDGTIFEITGLEGRKFKEVCNYATEMNLGFIVRYLIMNWDTWNSLPPDVQAAFDEFTGDAGIEFFDRELNRALVDFEKIVKETSDTEYIELSAEEHAKIWAKVKPVTDKAIAELEAKGLPARQIFDEWQRLLLE